ncbi:MAG TPA: DUF4233 domain-containing protein [Pseudonocardiaceae bacterium]|nr:DUF4233 domain-containing protein [Pseudonocardiaceae bacterium]
MTSDQPKPAGRRTRTSQAEQPGQTSEAEPASQTEQVEQAEPAGRRARTSQEQPGQAGQAEPAGRRARTRQAEQPRQAGRRARTGHAGQPEHAEPASQAEPAEPGGVAEPVQRAAVDPMKGFRGVMAGTLVLEAIVVALSLLVVAKLYGGLATGAGVLVGVVIVVLLITCGLLRRTWSLGVIAAAQVALICCFFLGSPGVGAVGALFALIWCYLLWLRWDVARRMAAGRLPSQQAAEPDTE